LSGFSFILEALLATAYRLKDGTGNNLQALLRIPREIGLREAKILDLEVENLKPILLPALMAKDAVNDPQIFRDVFALLPHGLKAPLEVLPGVLHLAAEV
jgi:hypothetical protein